MSVVERFLAKVERPPWPDSGCWIWRAATKPNKHGVEYGRFWFQGRSHPAHRVSIMLFKPHHKLTQQLVVGHTCDNPLCVNPDHLFVCTQQENVRDCMDKGRHGTHIEDRFICREEQDAYYASLLANAVSEDPADFEDPPF